MKLLGIDPGGTTGLCVTKYNRLDRPVGIHLDDLYPQLGLWVEDAHLVIMESFVATGNLTKGKIDQLRAIGAIEYKNKDAGNPPIVWITPEERKAVKKKIKVPYVKIPKPHAQDAYLLILAYALREGLLEPNGTELDFTKR